MEEQLNIFESMVITYSFDFVDIKELSTKTPVERGTEMERLCDRGKHFCLLRMDYEQICPTVVTHRHHFFGNNMKKKTTTHCLSKKKCEDLCQFSVPGSRLRRHAI